MHQTERLEEFKKLVKNKFCVYNSLFLNLPYQGIENVGMLIPLLFDQCEKGLKSGKKPQQILDLFFQNYANIKLNRKELILCSVSFNMLSGK